MLTTLQNSIVFNPTWITQHKLKKSLGKAVNALDIQEKDKWLDVGCGTKPYEFLLSSANYIGIDVVESGRAENLKSPDIYYDGEILPFQEGCFDGVLCTQALEHVPDAHVLLSEIHRVIKPGGWLIISVPFVWQEHEEPYDFFRFTRFGIAELLKKAGFDVVNVAKDTGAVETLAVTLNVYIIHNLVPSSIRGFGRLYNLFFCFPIQTIALILQMIFPDQGQLYLNLVVRAKKDAF